MTITTIDVMFEQFWADLVPFPWTNNAALKSKVRQKWNQTLEEFAKHAGHPGAARTLIAFMQLIKILRESKVILSENPDPEEVITAVQTLIRQGKLSDATEQGKR